MTQNEGTPNVLTAELTAEQEACFLEFGWHSRALFAAAHAAFLRGDEPEGRRIAKEDRRLKRAAERDRATSLEEG